ncbi:MAG: hypothetical protein JWO02_2735, partial [Solirubrobacterales bacterium]|nr:hypothetical protein [Solirubrobacterales bacterium]
RRQDAGTVPAATTAAVTPAQPSVPSPRRTATPKRTATAKAGEIVTVLPSGSNAAGTAAEPVYTPGATGTP